MNVYKDGKKKAIHSIDLNGWLKDGWVVDNSSIEKPTISTKTVPISGGDKPKAIDRRVSEIQKMDWRDIEKLSQVYGLLKDEGVAWKDMAITIAEYELKGGL